MNPQFLVCIPQLVKVLNEPNPRILLVKGGREEGHFHAVREGRSSLDESACVE